MRFIALLLPIFLLNACGGSSWLKQHTTDKEKAVQTQIIQTEDSIQVKEDKTVKDNSEEEKNQEKQEESKQTDNTAVNEISSTSKPTQKQEEIKKEETTSQIPSQKEIQDETKEEPKQEVNENDQIFLTKENRLAHPWYYAKETSTSENTPKWFGEELKFDISWSFITAGKAQLISSKIIEANGQKMYQLEAYAQSYPVIDAIFKVRDINMSWIAEDVSRSTGYWQSVKEGSYARDEWLIFDYTTNTYTIHKKDRKGNLEHKPHTFEGTGVVDMLSSLYFVRNQKLPLKGEVYFDIVNRGDQYPLKVVVLGKEKVKVKAGKFDCIVVEPMISGEGIFVSKGKSLKVWLTDDEYKMPVKMAVEVFIGSVKAELTEYTRK